VKKLPIKTERVDLPQFYEDEISHIRKRTFVMSCDSCTIYQNRGIAGCKSLGYCKFSKLYDELNKDFTPLRKSEIVKIMMKGYNNPR